MTRMSTNGSNSANLYELLILILNVLKKEMIILSFIRIF